MRNIVEVIDQMILKIPSTEVNLIKGLNKIKNSANYTAPELMQGRWYQVSSALSQSFKPPEEDWQFEVLSIFSTKSVGEIKSFYQGENR
jgi:hypothetical protein